MQTITPHLWFDHQAAEAAAFYTATFPDSRITHRSVIHDTPSGDCDLLAFTLSGHPFMAISAGPLFQFNPSISFILTFDPARDESARPELDSLWDKLVEGGTVLMPLGPYPFSERFGWLKDRYGVSWQFRLADAASDERPFIMPALMFTGEVAGKAEAAIQHYLSVFPDSRLGQIQRFGEGQAPNQAGSVMFADFLLAGGWFAAMDSAFGHGFGFNEAISLTVPCETQAEIDAFWAKLAADPDAGQCGWLKDAYGLSWQVWPVAIGEMMRRGDEAQVARLTRAIMGMTKYDLAALQAAFDGDAP